MEDRPLEGKAVIVTGAGRGLGAAYARSIAEAGAAVVVNDIDLGEGERVAAEIAQAGGKSVFHLADIGDWDAARKLIDACADAFGSVDGLVNNAGLFSIGRPDEITEAEVGALLRVNVTGTIACSVHAMERMRAGGGGSIVNVISGAAAGTRLLSVYGATKGAITTLTRSWAADLAQYAIRVNAISPMAWTRMGEAASRYMRREESSAPAPNPTDNVSVVIYLLSELAREYTGQLVRVQGQELSLMRPLGLSEPILQSDSWTPEKIDLAFRTELRPEPLPASQAGRFRLRDQRMDLGTSS